MEIEQRNRVIHQNSILSMLNFSAAIAILYQQYRLNYLYIDVAITFKGNTNDKIFYC